jgi:hypothetical protein
VSCQSVNGKGDNEMKPGAMHRSPGIYIMAEINPRKPQLDHLTKASNGVPYIQMQSVESHSISGREREDTRCPCCVTSG